MLSYFSQYEIDINMNKVKLSYLLFRIASTFPLWFLPVNITNIILRAYSPNSFFFLDTKWCWILGQMILIGT